MHGHLFRHFSVRRHSVAIIISLLFLLVCFLFYTSQPPDYQWRTDLNVTPTTATTMTTATTTTTITTTPDYQNVTPYPYQRQIPPNRSLPPRIVPNFTGLDEWLTTEPFIKQDDLEYAAVETTNCTEDTNDTSPLYLFLVHTLAKEAERRSIIRDTWASRVALDSYRKIFGVRVLVFFLLGTPQDPDLIESIARERIRHRDIVQGKLTDGWRNQTVRTVFGLKWAVKYCSNADFLIRNNDEVFVNAYNLFEFLNYFQKNPDIRPNTFFGHLKPAIFVDRFQGQKLRTTRDEYPFDMWPRFLFAYGYIMSMDFVKYVYDKALKTRFFWLDDIFLGLVIFNDKNVNIYRLNWQVKAFHDLQNPMCYRDAFFVHLIGRSTFVQYQWWTEIMSGRNLTISLEDRSRLRIAT